MQNKWIQEKLYIKINTDNHSTAWLLYLHNILIYILHTGIILKGE